MLIDNGDGTYIVGPLDVLCILRHAETGRFHAAFFEEMPMPGPVPPADEVEVIRLKSKMHHTEGSDTLEGAQEHLGELAKQLYIDPMMILRDPQEWDGHEGVVTFMSNPRYGVPA